MSSSFFKKIYIFVCYKDIYSHFCIQKSNNDDFHPLFTIIIFKWKVLNFLLSRIDKLDHDFLHLQIFFTCLPPE